MASITLERVSKSFGATRIIQELSLQVADGEFCVLVGPSGSGKSTLLRLIAGLEVASSGRVVIGERDVTTLPPKARDIAMVFQSYALYPQMTVRENMGFGLKLLKRPAAEIQRRVDAAATLLELLPLMERRPAQLSGGQRQRVAMGRAMVREPAAFLFDEPLSNLDAALRHSVRAEIRALHTRLATTSVYVTHDQVEAMTMGDRIVVLRDGRLEQAGTPVELYEKPGNRFVAGFIGSPAMNFLDRPAAVPSLGVADNPVVLGVRPEHLRLVDLVGAAAPAGPHLEARVQSIEFMGALTQLTLASAAGTVVVCAAERPPLRVGDNTCVLLDRQRLHWFDASSGARVEAVACA